MTSRAARFAAAAGSAQISSEQRTFADEVSAHRALKRNFEQLNAIVRADKRQIAALQSQLDTALQAAETASAVARRAEEALSVTAAVPPETEPDDVVPELERQLSESKSSSQRLANELEKSLRDASQLARELRVETRASKALEQERDALSTRLVEVERELGLLKFTASSTDAFQEQLRAANAEVAALTKRNAELVADNMAGGEELSALRASAKSSVPRRDFERAKERAVMLESEFRSSSAMTAQLRTQIDDLRSLHRSETASLLADVAQNKARLVDAERELEELVALRTTSAQVPGLENKLAAANERGSVLEARVGVLEDEIKTSLEFREELLRQGTERAEIEAALRLRIEELASVSAARQAELVSARGRVQELEGKNAISTEDSAAAAERELAHTKAMKSLQRAAREASERTVEAEQRADALERNLESERAARAALLDSDAAVQALRAETEDVLLELISTEEAAEAALTCMACLELLEDPVVLPSCQHVVCRKCLTPECPECCSSGNEAIALGRMESLSSKFALRRQALQSLRVQLQKND